MFEYKDTKIIAQYLRSMLSGERCTLCREGHTSGDGILCPECKEKLSAEASFVCSRCGALVCDCLCTTDEMKLAGIKSFVKLFPYYAEEGRMSNRLLFRLKSKKDRMLTSLVSCELAERSVPLLAKYASAEDCCVTYIPRSRKRIRENGVDQAKETAEALAKALGLCCLPLLHRENEGNVQKKLSNEGRANNVKGMFRADGEVPACVILFDDLVTTGATVCACARLLKANGAETVLVVSLAHTVGHDADYFNPV